MLPPCPGNSYSIFCLYEFDHSSYLISGMRQYLLYKNYFWLCWVFIAAFGLSLVVVSGSYSSCGFSLQWLLLLQITVSRQAGFSSCGSLALELRLSNCGTQA